MVGCYLYQHLPLAPVTISVPMMISVKQATSAVLLHVEAEDATSLQVRYHGYHTIIYINDSRNHADVMEM